MMSRWCMIQSLIITFIITCWCGGPFLVTTSADSYCRSSRFEEGCGKGYGLGYPFFNASYYSSSSINNTDAHHCGYPDLWVNCRRGRPVLNISNNLYYVLKDDYNYPAGYIRVVAVDVEEEECPRPTQNLTLQDTSFADMDTIAINYGSVIYFYNCSNGYPANTVQHLPCLDALRNNNNNTSSGGDPALRSFVFEQDKYPQNVGYDWYENCQQNVEVPVYHTYPTDNYVQYVRTGFFLQTQARNTDGCETCESSGGHCLLNQTIENRNQSIYENICSCEGDTNLYRYTCHQDHSVVKDDKCTQCERSGGICRHNQTNDHLSQTTEGFLCSCENDTKQYLDICLKGLSIGEKVTIGVFCGIGSLLLSILFLYRRRWSSLYRLWQSNHSSWEDETKPRNPSNVDLFIENAKCFGLQRYRYSEIKEITGSFREILGHGGFGSVFKGKLDDGRFVAVKVLNEVKGNGEDFINEVTTIGRTNHINVVSLLGFCSSGTKRALVYEFMSNGSLEKFIYDSENASITNLHLGWEKLYQIALGIAKGLEYLHHGCTTRILHFDIKPHNILLSEDLCPKISDFGLAKLCPTRQSIISMIGGRGTTGYIAPEVGNRVFGGVSHKSDVYSYGMMILEMVGGRKNMDLKMQNMSEIYFPLWIYNHFQQNMNVDDYEDIFKEETNRKMITVALWCIQMQPTDRPSMSKVVEMLEGNIEELQMPPNPFQNPPSRSSP